MDQDLVVLEAFFGEEKHISNCMHVGICDQVSVYILHSLCLSRSSLLNNLLYFPFTRSHTNSVCFTAPVSTLFLFLRFHCCTNKCQFFFYACIGGHYTFICCNIGNICCCCCLVSSLQFTLCFSDLCQIFISLSISQSKKLRTKAVSERNELIKPQRRRGKQLKR